VPASLDRIVSRCLVKDPDQRWQSAADLSDTLKWIAAVGSSVADQRQSASRRSHATWSAVAIVAVAALIVLGLFHRTAPDSRVLRLDVTTPPTADPVSFAISPDGKQLVFAATGVSGPLLFLRAFDESVARPLAGTEDARYPFWSPDSRSIAFFATSKLKRLDLGGGALQVLAEAGVGGGGSWSRDGVILYSQFRGLMRVSATGGTPVAVTLLPPADAGALFPEFLPDGVHFLFYVLTQTKPERQGVYLGSLDTATPTRILTADVAAVYAREGYLLVMRQGALLAVPFDATRGVVSGEAVSVASAVGALPNPPRGAFSVSSTGVLAYRMGTPSTNQLRWVDRTGKLLTSLASPAATQLFPELAPDGRHVAVQRERDIWLIDTDRGVPRRLTVNTISTPGVWSPDSRRLFFAAVPSGQIFTQVADGSRGQEPVLTIAGHQAMPNALSPNGEILLYENSASGVRELWALPFTGDRKPFPVVQTAFASDEGQFSPDGRWIAYRSSESGREEIYLQSFPGRGGKMRVSIDGGSQPRWRRDGKELFYVAPQGRLMAVSVGLLSGGDAPTIGTAAPLFTTHLAGLDFPRHGYDVAADGQRFLLNVVETEANAAPITLVVNWPVVLRH
jgi:Tol biopolymer transport system component